MLQVRPRGEIGGDRVVGLGLAGYSTIGRRRDGGRAYAFGLSAGYLTRLLGGRVLAMYSSMALRTWAASVVSSS